MNNYNCYTLFKFIKYISEYEDNLIPIIKSFLIPCKNDYLFQECEFVKKIMYEVSEHEHHNDSFLTGKYKQIYCPCYFNRKHKIFSSLKRRKSSIVVQIKSLEYNKDTYEKEYVIVYFINRVFSNETRVNENELEKIKNH